MHTIICTDRNQARAAMLSFTIRILPYTAVKTYGSEIVAGLK